MSGKRKVLITGANGLLAANTILALLEKDYSVVALLRDKSKFPFKAPAKLEIREGDITDTSSIENCFNGCDYLIHAAAETSQGLTDYAHYYRVNTLGTANVMSLAAKHKVKRVVYVSTSNVFGHGSRTIPGNESSSIRLPFSDSYYVKSKTEAQRIAMSYSDRMEVVAVNPTFMIGPYDQKPGSGRMVLRAYNKRILFYPPGGKNFIHVSDVARGIVRTLTEGENKESYLLANENMSYREFFRKVVANADTKTLMIKIPKPLLLLLGWMGNLKKRFNRDTEVTLNNIKMLCTYTYYSGEKARSQLKLNFQAVDSAIAESVDWFRSNNMIANQKASTVRTKRFICGIIIFCMSAFTGTCHKAAGLKSDEPLECKVVDEKTDDKELVRFLLLFFLISFIQ